MPWLHAPISKSEVSYTSPSLPTLLVRENRTECACSFFPIFPDEVFFPASQKTPIGTSDEKIRRVLSDVSDFIVQETRTTPRTGKLVRVATA